MGFIPADRQKSAINQIRRRATWNRAKDWEGTEKTENPKTKKKNGV